MHTSGGYRPKNLAERNENRVTTCLRKKEMSGNFTPVREMSGISVKITEMSEKILSQKLVPKNFPKNCVNRLFSIIHLVLYANYLCCLLLNFVLLANIYVIF